MTVKTNFRAMKVATVVGSLLTLVAVLYVFWN